MPAIFRFIRSHLPYILFTLNLIFNAVLVGLIIYIANKKHYLNCDCNCDCDSWTIEKKLNSIESTTEDIDQKIKSIDREVDNIKREIKYLQFK